MFDGVDLFGGGYGVCLCEIFVVVMCDIIGEVCWIDDFVVCEG